MKKIVFAAVAAIAGTALAAPAHALTFRWNVDYTGFFADGAGISGSFVADEAAAADGIVSADEFDSWEWSWSGNSEVDAFSISSADGEVSTLFDTPGFFVDGTPNAPAEGLDQGFYASDDFGLDLEFLFAQDFNAGNPFEGLTAFGDVAAGSVSVSDPEVVPEPGILLGLLTLAGGAAVAKRQKQAA